MIQRLLGKLYVQVLLGVARMKSRKELGRVGVRALLCRLSRVADAHAGLMH
ncbi:MULTISPECIES: hypothetical protein [unclassified Cupriavidus]|uniref:hypothetical protein n=1 Tax=unclassified Cupriavidus TaxID=2640874 RepID=UPI001484F4BE|nr:MULTISPECIES: hypothetical protein [unclassified Cupriavidus]